MQRFALFLLFGATALASSDDKSTDYVRSLRRDDGGYALTASAKSSTLKGTASCLRAQKYLGAESKDLDATRAFVRSCHVKDTGAFRDRPDTKDEPTPLTTAFGVMACVELDLKREEYIEPALRFLKGKARSSEDRRMAAAAFESAKGVAPKEWSKDLVDSANADGTWGVKEGRAYATASATVTLLRLGHKLDKKDDIRRCLLEGQREDGGFSRDGKTSDLEACYRVGRALHMLDASPKDLKALRSFVASCRNDDGGYGLAPKESSNAAATYFAAILSHWFK